MINTKQEMINAIFDFWNSIKKTRFMNWSNYKNRVDFLDSFYWSQKVRKQNIKNIQFF